MTRDLRFEPVTTAGADARHTGERERAIYEGRFTADENRARDRIWRLLVDEIFQPHVPADGTVLDLGCGFGEFIRHVACRRRIAVDLNTLSFERLVSLGVECHQGPIGELPFLADGSVDYAFSSNVLEHMPDKAHVDAALREAHRVLKPGGQLVLMGPNARLVPGAYWDYWDHFVPITDRSLAEALRLARFEVIEQVAAFMPYTTKSALPQAEWLVRLYLKNRWAWPILGRQFLLRARR